MLTSSLPLIVMGFGLGLMHALDADHVMAVSSLSNNNPGFLRMLKFCLNWAIGHAGVLLLSGMLLFGAGLSIPDDFIRVAEFSVGVLLIVLGLMYLWRFRKQRLRLSEHSHGKVVHRHWHIEDDHSHQPASDEEADAMHTPVLVGVLHGFAGSAPALALVPAVAQGNMLSALGYLLVFSLGVMLSMLLFGFGFGAIQQKIKKKYASFFLWQRHLIATCSIVVGSYWILQIMLTATD